MKNALDIERERIRTYYERLRGQAAELESELNRLLNNIEEVAALTYARRALEVMVTEICLKELKRDRGTEPLAGILEKFRKEKAAPENIIASMHNLNRLGTFGAHPKPFSPEQVKEAFVALATIIGWYILDYKKLRDERIQADGFNRESVFAANPYRGLDAFEEKDAAHFFGRENLIDTLLDKFKGLKSGDQARMLPIIGPSGSGKSSLVRAGLIPRLRTEHQPGSIVLLKPTDNPIETLAGVLAKATTFDDMPVAKTREFTDELKLPARDGLLRISGALPLGVPRPLILIVDQFEEIFTLCDNADDRFSFVENIMNAVRDPTGHTFAIIALRSDFLGETQRHPILNHAMAAQAVLVPMMSEEDLRLAVGEPAKRAGRPFDDAVVNLLVEQTRGREGSLPLLQFVLYQLWERMAEGEDPLQTLSRLGGVGGALARKAQDIYEALPETSKPIVRRIFLKLVHPGEGVRDTRRRIDIADLVAHKETVHSVRNILHHFSDHNSRLLTLSYENGSETVEITHETLIEKWDSLRDWIDAGRKDMLFERRLTEAARHWDNHHRPKGLLWRSPDLDRLRRFHRDASADMTELQLSFFKASEGMWKWGKRLKWFAVAMLVAFAITSGIWAFLAQKARKAEVLRTQSFSLVEAARRENEKGNNVKAALLALEALPESMSAPDRPYLADAEIQLYQGMVAGRKDKLLKGACKDMVGLHFSPDGRRLSTISCDREKMEAPYTTCTVQVWDVYAGQEIDRFSQKGTLIDQAFSRDGKLVAMLFSDSTAGVWEIDSHLKTASIEVQDAIRSIEFSRDSKRVVGYSKDGAVQVWDVYTGEKLFMKGYLDRIKTTESSPDGIYTVNHLGENVDVWRPDADKPKAILEENGLEVDQAVYSPKGKYIAAVSDQTIHLWDPENGKELALLSEVSGNSVVGKMKFSSNEQMIGVLINDHNMRGGSNWSKRYAQELLRLNRELNSGKLSFHEVREKSSRLSEERDLQKEKALRRAWEKKKYGKLQLVDIESFLNRLDLIGHEGVVTHASFSPDGSQIVTSSSDKTTRIWNAENGLLTKVIGGHSDHVLQAIFSPDGSRLATISKDQTVGIWDTQSYENKKFLYGHMNSVMWASFSPDGGRIATASTDHTARVWNIATGRPIAIIKGHSGEVLYVTFSPDGKRIATASADGAAMIWDAKTGNKVASLVGHEGTVYEVLFTFDGNRAITVSEDATVRIWDAENGKELRTVSSHRGAVTHVSLSPDGENAVTASKDKTARILDIGTGEEITVLIGHEAAVIHATFSPDGDRIVTASADKTARIWDRETGNTVAILGDHSASVSYAGYHPGGKRVVTVSEKLARLWRVFPTTQELIDYAKESVPRRLTCAERKQYFLDPDEDCRF
jgi:WD40 repeat protein